MCYIKQKSFKEKCLAYFLWTQCICLSQMLPKCQTTLGYCKHDMIQVMVVTV